MFALIAYGQKDVVVSGATGLTFNWNHSLPLTKVLLLPWTEQDIKMWTLVFSAHFGRLPSSTSSSSQHRLAPECRSFPWKKHNSCPYSNSHIPRSVWRWSAALGIFLFQCPNFSEPLLFKEHIRVTHHGADRENDLHFQTEAERPIGGTLNAAGAQRTSNK